jgi:glycosyltransferase involved in cell wall biosynthesis
MKVMWETASSLNKNGSPCILLVCDFVPLSRILDVYRFFKQPPRIILLTRGERVSTDGRLLVKRQQIPIPIITLESQRAPAAFFWAMLYLLYSFISYCKVRRQTSNVRLVHAHFIIPQGLFGLLLARLLHVPLIVTAAGQDVNVLMRNSVLLRAICRFVSMRADLTIAVSRPLYRLLRQFGVSNSMYLPNSVDTSLIHPSNSGFTTNRTMLFVGHMTARKRPLLLVRAFARVVAEVPMARLIMVGVGPLKDAVREEVQRRGLIARVKLFPRVTDEFLYQLLGQASVFVLPSVSEGLSLALLEAMAAGKVIVVSANESHREIFRNGCNALMFQPDNEKELVEQLTSALTNDQLGSRLSKSARQLCLREFSNAAIGEKLEMIYLNTILGRSQEQMRHLAMYAS